MHSIGDYYELWRAFYKHPAYQTFVDNYGVIIDVLNLYYPINVLFAGHSQTYQKRDIGLEFFADVYALHIIHNDKALSHIKELLPKSYQCYMDLMDYHQKHIS